LQTSLVWILLKIVAESPLCELKDHMGNDKMIFCLANDCSEEAPELEKFVFKFGTLESINLY
jgi:hypothetical protein